MVRRGLVRYDALLLTAVIWFLAKFLRYAFPPLFATLRIEYGVSTAHVGMAFSAMMFTYAFMQFPSGALADWFGPIKVITLGALVTGLGALSLVLDAGFPGLIAGMMLIGIGTGAHKTVAIRLLVGIYPAQTGRTIGAIDTVAAFGGVFAPLAVVVALPTWRELFLASGFVVIGLAAFFVAVVTRHQPASARDRTSDGRRVSLHTYLWALGRPPVALFIGVTVFVSFAYNGSVAFLPLYLIEVADIRPTDANTIFSLLFVASLIQLGTGELSDRTGRLPTLLLAIGTATIGLFALQFVSSVVPIGAAVLLFALGAHGYRPVRGAHLVAILPEDAAGGALGAVRTILMSAGALGPLVTGVLIETAGYRAAFTALGLALGLGAILVVALLSMEGGRSDRTVGPATE